MSWLKDAWQSVENAASVTKSFVTEGATNAKNYVVSGELIEDTVYVAQEAGKTASYIYHNPGHSLHVAGEGLQQGIGSGVGSIGGLIVGVAGGAGGALADGFNGYAQGVGVMFGQDWTLYEGSAMKTGFSAGFSNTKEALNDAIVGSTDFALSKVFGVEDPTIRNEHDIRIFGTAKGVGEVGSAIAVIAATGGTGVALIGSAGIRGGLTHAGKSVAGNFSSTTAKVLVGGATAYMANKNINDLHAEQDAQFNMLKQSILEDTPPANEQPTPALAQ